MIFEEHGKFETFISRKARGVVSTLWRETRLIFVSGCDWSEASFVGRHEEYFAVANQSEN